MKFKMIDMPFGKLKDKYGNLLFLIVVFFIGLLIGSLIAARTSDTDISYLISIVRSYAIFYIDASISSVLISSFVNNIIFFIAAFITGIMILGFALSVLLIFYKGFSVGFTVGFICALYGYKGLLICVLCLIPQIIITSVTLILSCHKSMQFSLSLFGLFGPGRRNKSDVPDLLHFCISFLFLFLISLSSLIFDVFVSPFFLNILLK